MTLHGTRIVKGYCVTEEELRSLFKLGLWAAICFTLAAELVRFGLELQKDIAFSSGIAPNVIDSWQAVQSLCFCGAAIFALLLIWLIIRGNNKIGEIKGQTDFNEKGE
jgi:hypothetical protein